MFLCCTLKTCFLIETQKSAKSLPTRRRFPASLQQLFCLMVLFSINSVEFEWVTHKCKSLYPICHLACAFLLILLLHEARSFAFVRKEGKKIQYFGLTNPSSLYVWQKSNYLLCITVPMYQPLRVSSRFHHEHYLWFTISTVPYCSNHSLPIITLCTQQVGFVHV